MQRALLWLVLLAMTAAGMAARAETDPMVGVSETDPFVTAPFLTRSALLEAVVDRNPSLEAARQAWIAASEEIAPASSLDDPTVSYAMAPTSVVSSSARFGAVLNVGQRLPYPGTLRHRGEVARARAATAEQDIAELRLELVVMASRLYDETWLVDRSLEINEQHLELLASLQRVAAGRYSAGLAPQQAPIQAEVERAHRLHHQVVLESERRRLGARLNALLHRPVGAPLPPAPSRLPVDVSTAAVDIEAPSRPEVARQQAEIGGLRNQVELERLRLKPDFQVTTTYNSMWRTPQHRWAVGLALRLPVWRQKLHASVAAAEARLLAGESTLTALSDTIAAEIESARASLEEAQHIVRLHRSRLLPATKDQLQAARAGFETGEVSMLALIDAERSLHDAELSEARAIAAVWSARAELDRALGRLPFSLPLDPAASQRAMPRVEDQR